MAIGPRDLEKGTVEVARRDTREKMTISMEGASQYVVELLDEIQQNIFRKASDFRKANTHQADTWDEFCQLLEEKGGFIMAHWDGTPETEQQIKEKTKATIRCIQLDKPEKKSEDRRIGKRRVRKRKTRGVG